PKLSAREREALERLQREEEQEQMSLFQPTPEELKAAEELRTQAEDLLFRSFYRALKARIMTHQNPVPVQVMRRETFLRPDDEGLAGILPTRVVVHKTSTYQPEEERGFRLAAEARVPACDLVWMRSTAFRLIRKGMQEPWRGTLCNIGHESYLFTMGYVSWWD